MIEKMKGMMNPISTNIHKVEINEYNDGFSITLKDRDGLTINRTCINQEDSVDRLELIFGLLGYECKYEEVY